MVGATTNIRRAVSHFNHLYRMLLLIIIEYYLPNDEVGSASRENGDLEGTGTSLTSYDVRESKID